MQWIEWHRIVAYRDFPRYVLVANATEDAFLILDSGDSPIYTIHHAGSEASEATAAFERYATGTDEMPAIGCIPVEHVQFDERAALKLTSPPVV